MKNKLIFCILFCLTFNALYSNDEQTALTKDAISEPQPIYVSLGSYCTVANMLRANGLRNAAYPFDWVLSLNGEKIVELIENDFLNFMDDRLLVSGKNRILLQHYYQIEFSHELKWYKNLQKVKDKYNRRITRFRDLKNHQGKLYFIRSSWVMSNHRNYHYHNAANLEMSEDYAFRLYDALNNYFPLSEVYLIILNETTTGDSTTTLLGNILILKSPPIGYPLSNLMLLFDNDM